MNAAETIEQRGKNAKIKLFLDSDKVIRATKNI
jgi:hypothetical protein